MSKKKNKGKNKQQKTKVVYYDDGSTIADMSSVRGGISGAFKINNGTRANGQNGSHNPQNAANGQGQSGKKQKKSVNYAPPKATFRDKAHTFFTAMKMMVIPMCVVLAALAAVYLVVYLITR